MQNLKGVAMSLKNRLKSYYQEKSRNSKLEHFYSLFDRPVSLLDVGVSSLKHHEKRTPANYFLKTFRFPAECYTGLAVDETTGLEDLYPGKHFVTYDGRIFPFSDNQFEAVFSNAVVEHVGDSERQLLFINEMLRVGKKVFFTTPNKWFPLETHTNAFLRHWNDKAFFKWCRVHHPFYTKETLNLLSHEKLDGLMRRSDASSYRIYRNRLFGYTLTFSVVCSK